NPLQMQGVEDDQGRSTSGEGGIRTLVTLAGKSVFETDAFNHSATSPNGYFLSACSSPAIVRDPAVLPRHPSSEVSHVRVYQVPACPKSPGRPKTRRRVAVRPGTRFAPRPTVATF